MTNRLKQRIAQTESQGGFTLIELLVVIIIIGILLAIAVPSYLGFRDRANRSAAQANVRAAIPSVETYAADNTGAAGDSDNNATTTGYAGMTTTLLKNIDAGLAPKLVVSATLDADTYCVQASEGGFTYSYGLGSVESATWKNGQVNEGACP